MPLADRPLLFDFEIVSSEDLTYIPMCVRFNLDDCDMHLSLAQWQCLPHAARLTLAQMPLAHDGGGAQGLPGGFAAALGEMMTAAGAGAPQIESRHERSDALPWQQLQAVPDAVLRQCALHAMRPLALQQWQALGPFQRYVLVKLSRRDTPNHDFLPALREFSVF